MKQRDRFRSYRFGEGMTGGGQLISFTCPLDVTKAEVCAFLLENVRDIDIPTTSRTNVAHGGYGQYTRYNIIQHKYAGGGPDESGRWGYVEILEIENPPDNHWGIVINECTSHRGNVFYEWETLENAHAAFKKHLENYDNKEWFSNLAGFKRRVVCGELTPWFYAIGNQLLVGDFSFPEGLHDDAVYRFGQQFVVFDNNGFPSIKTCMGTRFVTCDQRQYRFVSWNDGSVWNEKDDRCIPPRPLQKDEMWITEAIQQFSQLIAGKISKFNIKFTNGHEFAGKLTRPNPRTPCAEGDYLIVAHLKNKGETREGWVKDFKPTPETPDIVQYVTQRFAQIRIQVEYIEIKECRRKKGGKKWSGAFFHPSP